MTKYVVFVSICVVGVCVAESFLVKKERRQTPQQMKHEITQLMGTLVEQSGVSLELEGQVQQRLCKELRTSVEGAKESMLKGTSDQELRRLVQLLRKEVQRRSVEQEMRRKFLAALPSPRS